VKKEMTGMAVRSLFLACVRPIFEYGLEVWNFAIQAKNKLIFVKKCLKTPTATATPTKPTPSDSYPDPTTF
jgi:hypothetical protein